MVKRSNSSEIPRGAILRKSGVRLLFSSNSSAPIGSKLLCTGSGCGILEQRWNVPLPQEFGAVFAMRFLNLNYTKRYRMELDMRRWRRPPIELPVDYGLVPWHDSLVEAHGEVKFHSFRDEIDAHVFPCLGEYEGCCKLMEEIRLRDGFLPESTWLAEYVGAGPAKAEYCGTIQAVRTHKNRANIQNIGVAPFHRGRGLGTRLILAALTGFQYLGIARVGLEVTAENEDAVRLYRRLGFRQVRTLYKAVELAPSLSTR